jgi:serine protease Do
MRDNIRSRRADLGTRWMVSSFLFTLCCVWAPRLHGQPVQQNQPADPLHQLNSSVEAIVKRVAPSVVQVIVTGFGPVGEGNDSGASLVVGRQRSMASGVIIDPDGYIITSAHLVRGVQHIEVVLPSPSPDSSPLGSILSSRGHTLEARTLGLSREIDLAVLKVDAKGLPALRIGNYSLLRQGELVFAFGSPEGLRNSVTMGVVSAIARQPDPDNPMVYIQTDAPINPGNSGGPLVDVDGELVGINTFILSQSGGNESLGFAIPSGILAVAYPHLRKYGHVHRGEIGVSVQSITPSMAAGLGLGLDHGVIVSDVLPGSPAKAAGLRMQDIIISIDGAAVDDLPTFSLRAYMLREGTPTTLRILRGTEKLDLQTPVVEHRHNADRLVDLVDRERNLVGKLGILGIQIDKTIAPMLPDLREASGVIVAAKTVGTSAVDNPLPVGDVIHALNGTTVIDLDYLRTSLESIKFNDPVVLQIEREGRMMFLAFRMD